MSEEGSSSSWVMQASLLGSDAAEHLQQQQEQQGKRAEAGSLEAALMEGEGAVLECIRATGSVHQVVMGGRGPWWCEGEGGASALGFWYARAVA